MDNPEYGDKSAEKVKTIEKKNAEPGKLDRAEHANADKPSREQTGAKPRESVEREVRDNGPAKAGYTSGETHPPKEVLDKMWSTIPEHERRAAQTDPNSIIYITASASRLGAKENNQRLTDERGKEVEKYLRENRKVVGKIEIDSLGERDDPTHTEDDPQDRFVEVNVYHEPRTDSSDNAVPNETIAASLADAAGLGDRSKQNHIPEFLDTVAKEAIDLAQKAPGALADNVKDKQFQHNVSLNQIPAMHQELDKAVFGDIKDNNWPGPFVDSPLSKDYSEKQRAEARKYVAEGRMIVDKWLNNLTPEMREAVRDRAKEVNRWHALHQAMHHALINGMSQRRGQN
jgi:outer membrane protein OmpA-like peptidoglycan-associated protein